MARETRPETSATDGPGGGRSLIERVETSLLALPLDPPFTAAIRRFDRVYCILAEIACGDGAVGVGTGFAFSSGDAKVILSAIQAAKPVLLGASTSQPEKLWRQLSDNATFLGRSGAASSAIGILDTALWDLHAKKAGMPLWRMLGGAQDQVIAYASGGSLGLSNDELVAEMQGFVDAGFAAVKLKIGRQDWHEDIERLAECRTALGDRVRIAADANQSWSLKETVQRAGHLAQFDLWWLEEPLPCDAFEELGEVRASVPMPLASGETNANLSDFARLLNGRAVDILMPNVQRVGGITPWRKIAAAAEMRNVPIGAHVQPEIQMHLMCAVPNGLAVEHVAWWPWPYEEPLSFEGGMAKPPEAPGLGVTLDRDFVNRHRVGHPS